MSDAALQDGARAEVKGGPVWAAYLFLFSLVTPFHFNVGPLLLMPHRGLLLLLFVPFFLDLFVFRRAGRVHLFDWLMFGSALWGALALIMNHGFALAVQPMGIHMLEFFGAYLVARVAIRTSEDFRKVVKLFFLILLVLLPFAAAESILRRPVLLDLLPGNTIRPVNTGVRMNMRRAQAVFTHPIHFGVFVSTGLGIVWYALRPRWLRFPGAPIVVLSTIFSLSTGALISLVMQTIFIAWEKISGFIDRRWTLFGILSVISYFVVDMLSNRTPFHVLVTYASFNTGSAYNRILIWRYGTDNVEQNPLWGIGLNDWVRPSWMSSSVDNFWLFIAMKFGLPAAIMFIVAVVLIIRKVSWAEISDPDTRLLRAGFLTSIGGIIVAGGTVHYWHAMMAFVLFMFGSGVWALNAGGTSAATPPDDPERERAPTPRYSRQSARHVRSGAITAAARSPQPARARRASTTSR